MSMFSALLNSGRVNSIQQALGVKDITSAPMKAAIDRWLELYYNCVGKKEEDSCQRLPVAIVNKLVKTTFSEYSAKVVVDSSKAGVLDELLREAGSIKAEVMQHCFVGGECMIKPVPLGGRMQLMIMRRDCYMPLARDAKGKIIDVASTEQTTQGSHYYTLLERRTVMSDNSLRIITKLYRADNSAYLGQEIPLGTLPQYAKLQPVAVLSDIKGIGVVQIRTPLLNTVDGSKDGVAIYAHAEGLICNIDHNEWQLNREFDLGRSRIVVPDEMLDHGRNGGNDLKDDVFTAIDGEPSEIGITVFSPTLREQSYLARKNEYLRNIESLIGFKRGILSDVEAVERTATEVTSSAGDYNLTIIDLQQTWEAALRELIGLCDRLGQMYGLCDSSGLDPDTDIVVDWGNGILYDADKTWTEYVQMVQAGMLRPEIALAWKFNLPCETPEDIVAIRAKYMPDMEAMIGGE